MKKTILLLCILTASIFFVNAQWQQTNGPDGGYVQCIATNGSSIFAGTGDNIYLSTNNGSSWTGVNNGITADSYIYSIVFSGSNVFAAAYSQGLLVSSDNGGQWTRIYYFSATGQIGAPGEWYQAPPRLRHWMKVTENSLGGTTAP